MQKGVMHRVDESKTLMIIHQCIKACTVIMPLQQEANILKVSVHFEKTYTKKQK